MTEAEYKDACVAVAPYFNTIAIFLQDELKNRIMLDGSDVDTIQKQFKHLSILTTRIKNDAVTETPNK